MKTNFSVIFAGILSLIIGVGVARFAFTSLLPLMLEKQISVEFTGYLASLNYAGYFLGAVVTAFLSEFRMKVYFFRAGLLICIVTTFVLGLSTNEILWAVSRFLAGVGTAMCLIVSTSLVMVNLNVKNKTKIMGIHFTGIGFAILTTDIIVKIVNFDANLWQMSWVVLSLFASALFVYPWRVLTYNKSAKGKKFHFDKSLFTAFAKILIVAYFCEGVGFVVQATFLPDIINNLQGLEGYGGLAWLFVGIAGIPSSIIWMRLAHKYTSLNMIILAMIIQIIGILIPTFTQNILLNLISGAIYGSTFIGLTALFMNLGGKLSGENPVVLMGAITSAYSLGMIVAPLYSVAFFEKYKSYNYSLYLTAGVVMFGVLLLIYGKKFNKKENKCLS